MFSDYNESKLGFVSPIPKFVTSNVRLGFGLNVLKNQIQHFTMIYYITKQALPLE